MKKSIVNMQGAIDRLPTIKNSSSEKIEVYAKRCWIDFMNPNIIDWWNDASGDTNVARAITRPFYDLVHSCSVPTGLISESAFNSHKKTKDHCFRPQFIYRFMLDNHEQFEDFSVFREWFIMCCSTILVTPNENDRLSSEGTKNHGGEYVIMSPTDKQYIRAKLDLYAFTNERSWNQRSLVPMSNFIDAPQVLLDYEKQYIPELPNSVIDLSA
tara:strand:- start:4941 stop:5579 length:639 start_codon:yes stop_codon:yes gene_type:complete